ncbi:erythromycin esterase family protein [Nocardia sp. NPDC003482]
MSTVTALRAMGRALDDPESLGRALDELLGARREPPALFALGEPTHGIPAFPLLRNDILAHLVERGFRSIALESDFFAAALVDDYVNGSAGAIDTVLRSGFSHRFGNVPGNRELVEWLRAHNADRVPADRVHFYGFDAPFDQTELPSPRGSLTAAIACLPDALRPESACAADDLLGDDGEWTNAGATYDPELAFADPDRLRALRVLADDVASALRRAAAALRAADPAGYDLAAAHARTAQGLLRYHTALARRGPDRIALLLSLRAEMMADNLLAILAREQHRGPTLVFAHNTHLRRARSRMTVGAADVSWDSAGALVATALGEWYVFVATDADPHSESGTLQGELAAVTARRALFPAPALRAALPAATTASAPIVPGHIPLTPDDLDCADAVVFVADTDAKRYPYW